MSPTQAVTGQVECVEALLQRGASVCVRDIRGRSPLHLASACGRMSALDALLQAGTTAASHTHAHLTDNQGYTPLHWACYNGTGGSETHLAKLPRVTPKQCLHLSPLCRL